MMMHQAPEGHGKVLNKYNCGRIPASAVNIMRPGPFGNPYRIYGTRKRLHALKAFEAYLRRRCRADADFRQQVRELYGKDLVCCCAPQACHGDILHGIAAELRNGEFWT